MTVRKIKDTVSVKLQSLTNGIEDLPRQAYHEWVRTTPKKSGNARRHTNLKGDAIHADYPYAQRLDQGWSKQAPNGMSEPITKFLERELQKLIRK